MGGGNLKEGGGGREEWEQSQQYGWTVSAAGVFIFTHCLQQTTRKRMGRALGTAKFGGSCLATSPPLPLSPLLFYSAAALKTC